MFIFYYAVLSEVSPPTALSPFAAAAITGGSPYATTLQSWKYCTPAFLVPFMRQETPAGVVQGDSGLITGRFDAKNDHQPDRSVKVVSQTETLPA